MRRRPKPARSSNDVTTISARGQTVVPARIRAQLGLREGSRLAWLAGPDSIVVTPVPEPEVLSNRVNVDTGAFATGRLTALVVDGAGKQLLFVEEAP